MNDTFLSIGNATAVAGWEIRVGFCRYPQQGKGHVLPQIFAVQRK